MLNQYRSTQNILKTANAYVNTDNIRPKLLFEGQVFWEERIVFVKKNFQ